MTNREWMEQLSHEDLAKFLTIGLRKQYISNLPDNRPFIYYESIKDIARNYTNAELGILDWLCREYRE